MSTAVRGGKEKKNPYSCISHVHKTMGLIPSKGHRMSLGETCKGLGSLV